MTSSNSSVVEYFSRFHNYLITLQTSGFYTGFDNLSRPNYLYFDPKKIVYDIRVYGEEVFSEIDRIKEKIKRIIEEKEQLKSRIRIGDLNDFLAEQYQEPTSHTPQEKEDAFNMLKRYLERVIVELDNVKMLHKEFLAENKIISNNQSTRKIDSAIIERVKPGTDLDRYQITLLFHYLRDKNVFKGLSNDQLGLYANILTGFSENKVGDFMSSIEQIKKDEVEYVRKKQKETSNYRYYNLESVRKILVDIVKDIDEEIKK